MQHNMRWRTSALDGSFGAPARGLYLLCVHECCMNVTTNPKILKPEK